MGVERGGGGDGFPVKGDITVGLVADEEDGVAVGAALLGQQLGQSGQGLGGVNDACGGTTLRRAPVPST